MAVNNQTNGSQTRMPLPGEKSAPKWTGKEKHIPEFIRTFEVVADQANLSDENEWKQLGRYCKRPKDQELIENLPGFKTNWEEYKKDIM